MTNYKIILNDCLDAMREMEDNSIDFIVTDSPYGVSFMSKHWDKEIPPHEYWKEMLRICKPGSYMACAGLPRMMHRLTSIVEDSGWIIRDMIIHIFGSGFPKSNNFGKKLDEPWNGYGTALKPAWEGWTLAMKPLDGTFAQNAEKWGVAGINIDGCRIEGNKRSPEFKKPTSESGWNGLGENKNLIDWDNTKGRWPANIIFDEESAQQLDQMTKDKIHSAGSKRNKVVNSNYLASSYDMSSERQMNRFGDVGAASRFFYCAKASSSERNKGLEGMPLKESRPLGISNWDGQTNGSGEVMGKSAPKANSHPTVKPISLMKYIITLLAPPGNPICLDPFMGSGSTGVACKELGISFLGIEKEKEYVDIASKRLDHAQCASQKQMEMF